MAEGSPWLAGEQTTIGELLDQRLETDPDGAYLDVCGTSLSAADVASTANRLANALASLGVGPGDRVATLVDNSPAALLGWWGAVRGAAVAVPINTAYKGSYLRHQLDDSGARVLVVQRDLLDRAAAVVGSLDALGHVVVVDDGSDGVQVGGDILGGEVPDRLCTGGAHC